MVIRVKHKYIFFFQHIIAMNCPYNFPLIYFITTFRPLLMYSPGFVGLPLSLRPSRV